MKKEVISAVKLLLVMAVVIFTGCAGSSKEEGVLESISIKSMPLKISYNLGEKKFDIRGMEVEGIYDDGSKKELTVTTSNITGFETNTIGTKFLTVTINKKSTSFKITVETGFETKDLPFGYCEIVKYTGTSKWVEIPEEINGKTVSSIGDNSFASKTLIEVSMPNTVVTIGDFAFASNNLTKINISSSTVKIGESAFRGNNLTELTLPDSITSIANYAFLDNSSNFIVHVSAGSYGETYLKTNKIKYDNIM